MAGGAKITRHPSPVTRHTITIKQKTMKKDLTLLILAAGMGSRYGGLKQLEEVGPNGQTIMDYSVYDAIRAGFNKVVFVIRKDFEQEFKEKVIKKYEGKIETACVFQGMDTFVEADASVIENRQKPWGAAHAVLVAKDHVKEPFAVINADDYYGEDAFVQVATFLADETSPTLFGLVGYQLVNTLSDNGTVNRGVCQVDENAFLTSIFEGKKIAREDGKILHHTTETPGELSEKDQVSMNFFGFHPAFFNQLHDYFKNFVANNTEDPKAELPIPPVIDELINQDKIQMKVLSTSSKWIGMTYQEDKEWVQNSLAEWTEKGAYPSDF